MACVVFTVHERLTGRPEVSNDDVAKFAADNPDIAIPFASLDPHRGKQAVDEARRAGNTLGGIFEVVVRGLPPGLGSYTSWDRKLDGRLAQAVASIHAVKAVEIGSGVAGARKPGSLLHDEIVYDAEDSRFRRSTNRAGGLEGGVTTGSPVVVRAAMKPLPTLMQPLRSVDLSTGEAGTALVERSDVQAVEALAVVAEAAVAWELAGAAALIGFAAGMLTGSEQLVHFVDSTSLR